MNGVVTKLNENSGYSKSNIEYPSIEILNATDALAVLMSCLEQGDIPVYLKHNDNLHKLKFGVNPNPLNIKKLISIYKIAIHKSATESFIVSNTTELLDLGAWWKWT